MEAASEVKRKRRFSPALIADVLKRYKEYVKADVSSSEACKRIALLHDLEPKQVYDLINRLTSTADVAKEYLGASAFKLAARIVRKANVDQAIDILSRPNIGVLEPLKQAEKGGQEGFFLSVSAESCGAVRVAVGQSVPVPGVGPGQAPAEAFEPLQLGGSVLNTLPETPTATIVPEEKSDRFLGKRVGTQAAIAARLAREEKARKRKLQRKATEIRKRIKEKLAQKTGGEGV